MSDRSDRSDRNKLLTSRDVERRLNVSPSTITRLRQSKELGPWVQLTRRWYIREHVVDEFIDRKMPPMAAE